jgi:hypothetical protein
MPLKDNKVIIDNFLDKNDLKASKEIIFSRNFPWFFSPFQTLENKDSSYFFHIFYINYRINSNFFKIVEPIIQILNPLSLINIRANCVVNRKKSDSDFHTDAFECIKLNHMTAIFYFNTNNGYTLFKDKSKVKCVENRMVIFPSSLEHKAVAQTDTERRIVVNFNFFPRDNNKQIL